MSSEDLKTMHDTGTIIPEARLQDIKKGVAIIGKPNLFKHLFLPVIFLILIGVTGCGNAGSKSSAANDLRAKDQEVESITINNVSASAFDPSNQNLSLMPADIKAIKQKGKLTVSMYCHDRPPFFYVDKDGNLVGIDVDLAKDIAGYLGVDVAFDRSAQSFEEVVDKVALGEADLGISKLSITLSRAQRVSFTQPYITLHQALLVNRLKLGSITRNSGSSVKNIEQMINGSEKIGVHDQTAYVDFARILFPTSQITRYPTQAELVEAVRSGDVLAVLYDENELKNQVKQNPDLLVPCKLYILQNRVDQKAIAVAPDNLHLLSWLNTYINITQKDQAIQQEFLEYRQEGNEK
ncbi:MAG: ABC transporter substrate-binding protein [Syntrophomonas sp.]